MAPTSDVATASSPLQVVLGITLPFLLVASAIPAIMIKRHLDYRATLRPRLRRMQTSNAVPRRLRTSRLPLRSMYLTRFDYYLPPTNTATSFTTTMDGTSRTSFPESGSSVPSLPLLPTIPGSFSHLATFDPTFLELNHTTSLNSGVSAAPSAIPSSVGLDLPSLGSLPALSAELCEFASYADVIDSRLPEVLPRDVYRSSTSLLHMAFSAMDVNALSFDSLSQVIRLHEQNSMNQPGASDISTATLPANPSYVMRFMPTIQTLGSESKVVVEEREGGMTKSRTGSYLVPDFDFDAEKTINETLTNIPTLQSIFKDRSKHFAITCASQIHESSSVMERELLNINSEADSESIASDSVPEVLTTRESVFSIEDVAIELNTSNLDPSTTTWSFSLDSSSTLASAMAVRLSQFPPVPGIFSRERENRHEESKTMLKPASLSQQSKVTSISRSLSLPTSMNLLEVKFDDILLLRQESLQGHVTWVYNGVQNETSRAMLGELWDEDDEYQFACKYLELKQSSDARIINAPSTSKANPIRERHTWTAGMPAPLVARRVEIGDLWDDEDERRVSCIGRMSDFKIVSFGSLTLSARSESKDEVRLGSLVGELRHSSFQCSLRDVSNFATCATLARTNSTPSFDGSTSATDLEEQLELCIRGLKVNHAARSEEDVGSLQDLVAPGGKDVGRGTFLSANFGNAERGGSWNSPALPVDIVPASPELREQTSISTTTQASDSLSIGPSVREWSFTTFEPEVEERLPIQSGLSGFAKEGHQCEPLLRDIEQQSQTIHPNSATSSSDAPENWLERQHDDLQDESLDRGYNEDVGTACVEREGYDFDFDSPEFTSHSELVTGEARLELSGCTAHVLEEAYDVAEELEEVYDVAEEGSPLLDLFQAPGDTREAVTVTASCSPSAKARWSALSMASVVDGAIVFVEPIASYADFDGLWQAGITEDCGEDMDLEEGYSYSSRITSIAAPICCKVVPDAEIYSNLSSPSQWEVASLEEWPDSPPQTNSPSGSPRSTSHENLLAFDIISDYDQAC